MLSCKEKLTKKNKIGASFTDDGFVMGEVTDLFCASVIGATNSAQDGFFSFFRSLIGGEN